MQDEVVSDEKTRIDDLRTVAKWQLAALGAVASAAFAGVAVNRMPNPADPAGGGWAALWVAGVGAALTLGSVALMITLVGWVLSPQFRPLDDRQKPWFGHRHRWYDDPVFYLPDVGIRTLRAFLNEQHKVYRQCQQLTGKSRLTLTEQAQLDRLNEKLTAYFIPVNLRLHWRNRRETVARRARISLVGLGVLGFTAAVGAVLYLGALADHRPETTAAQTFGLPAYGLWRPLSVQAPRLGRELLASELGARCAVVQGVAGVQVMVLRETPAGQTFEVLVTASGCTPRLYTVPQAEVTASDAFALPPR